MNELIDDLEVGFGGIAQADHDMDDASVAPSAGRNVPLTGEQAWPERRSRRENRRRRRRQHRRRRWMAAIAGRTISSDPRQRRQDRVSRLRLLAWTAVGVACLLAAHRFQPDKGSLFAMPSTAAGWAWLLCAGAGFWLVPGLWMSSILTRTGAGLTPWLANRIVTTLAWYALVSPVIHQLGQGAQITTKGILIATVGASAAVSLGVLLGMSSWPARLWQRLLVPAVTGGVCAQAVITVSTHVWTYDMNYAHIRRLDWLIVVGCALLVTLGTLSRPKTPPARTIRSIPSGLVSLAVVASTVAALVVTNTNWSPAQQMPSAFGIEQAPAPAGADIAFSLTAIGPDGPALIRQSEFSAFDEAGRAVPVQIQLMDADSAADDAMLLVVLQQGSQPVLCRPGRAAKLTVRDRVTGVRMQAVVPDGWCTA
ncbi:MAG TPA: hypothetical protein VHH12_02600 [Mycobacterium sp.]|nr:hypothetical protein [Mycobacterium sp.]